MIIHLGKKFNTHMAVKPTSELGVVYLNLTGLLSLLNIQLGLACTELKQNTRIIQYLSCLKKGDNNNRFYSQSLLVDELGVATILLSWRDDLYLAGWDSKNLDTQNLSKRLFDLVEIEHDAIKNVSANDGQLLTAILEQLSSASTQITEIHLYDDFDVIPYQWQKVLNKLSKQTTKLILSKSTTFTSSEANKTDLQVLQSALFNFKKIDKPIKLKGDGTVQVVKSQSKTNSAQLISLYIADKNKSKIVLAETQQGTLEQLFVKNDLPRQNHSNYATSRSVLQLLPLALQLLWKPLDINHLLSFLVHPVNIFPAFVSKKLSSTVAKYPGVNGRHWDDAIDKLKQTATKFDYDKQSIDDLVKQISYWFNNELFLPEEGAPIETIQDRCEKIQHFLNKRITGLKLKQEKIDNIDDILSADVDLSYDAVSHCEQMIELLEQLSQDGEKTLNQLKLKQLTQSIISQGSTLPLHDKQANAPYLINDPSLLICKVNELIWWDMCMTKSVKSAPWSDAELNVLRQRDIHYVSASNQVEQNEQQALNALFNVKERLIIVLHSGEENHSLWDKIATVVSGWETLQLEEQIENNQLVDSFGISIQKQSHQPLPERKRWWHINNGELLTRREVESFSSLENLIKSPYQWVLSYKAKLSAANLLSISDGNQLKGTTTHDLFELFFNKHVFNQQAIGNGDDNWNTLSEESIKNWVDIHFDQLIEGQAAVYLEIGQLRDKEAFRETILQALLKLIGHLKSANIQQIKTENKNNESCFVGKMTGSIDMLLTNDKGEEIILDLKWGGEKYKHASLIENSHIQLAIYAFMRKQKNNLAIWPEQAFFIIETGNVLAQNNLVFPQAIVAQPEEGQTTASLWNQLEHSFLWRRSQLNQGNIEMTIAGTIKDEFDSVEPSHALKINETNDYFNDYSNLMGW